MYKNFELPTIKVYECPKVVLREIFIEESISTSSTASIGIGESVEEYYPTVEKWGDNTETNVFSPEI